jgi:hypothetical protein
LLFGWGEFPVAPSVCHVNWRTTIITMIKTIIIRISPFFCFPPTMAETLRWESKKWRRRRKLMTLQRHLSAAQGPATKHD